MFKRIISSIILAALLISSCVSSFALSAQKNLLYIGDSFSYYYPYPKGVDHFVLEKIYADSVADEFGYELLTADNYPTIFDSYGKDADRYSMYKSPLAEGGYRSTDVLSLISDSYNGDDYTDKEFGFTEKSKANARKAVSDADIITIQLGYSNIACYLLNNLYEILGLEDIKGESSYSYDLNQLKYYGKMKDYLEFTESAIEAVKAEMGDNLSLLSKSKIERNKESDDSAAIMLYKSVKYALTSAIVDFDRLVKELKTQNPNAKIYVMGLNNTSEDIEFAFSLIGDRHTVAVCKIISIFLDYFNLYMKKLSPMHSEYVYVEPASEIGKFGDIFGRIGNDKAKEITGAFIKASLEEAYNNEYKARKKAGKDYSESAIKASIGYGKAEIDGIVDLWLPGAMKIAADKKYNCLKLLAEGNFENVGDCFDKFQNFTYLNPIFTETDKFGRLTASELEQCSARLYLTTTLHSAYLHPSQEGHDAMAGQLIKAINKDNVKDALFGWIPFYN